MDKKKKRYSEINRNREEKRKRFRISGIIKNLSTRL